MLALRPLDHDAATPVMKNAPEQNQDRRRQTPATSRLHGVLEKTSLKKPTVNGPRPKPMMLVMKRLIAAATERISNGVEF